jgi:flagellar basal-body rod protein FlgG
MKVSVTDDGSMLVTADGYPILGIDDTPLFIPGNVAPKDISIDEEGKLSYLDGLGQHQDLGLQIKLVQFPNPQGLEAIGSNLLRTTTASGLPLIEADGETNRISHIRQGVLEMSNVQVAEEMVNLIVAQRAFDLNSKGITTSDEMLQTANNLKR